jgi:hypothetical protein
MPQNALVQIHELLAAKRYAVTETSDTGLRIQEVDSGLVMQAELQGEILFFSIVCATVPANRVTKDLMTKMLDAGNGISTSHFQLTALPDGQMAISLNNFCKLQEMGPDDEDDILSCVSFLLADVMHARDLLAGDLQ